MIKITQLIHILHRRNMTEIILNRRLTLAQTKHTFYKRRRQTIMHDKSVVLYSFFCVCKSSVYSTNGFTH